MFLAVIVGRVAPIEQRALLGGTTRWRWGLGPLLGIAALLSLSVKAWSSPHPGVLIVGVVGTLTVWAVALRRRGGC